MKCIMSVKGTKNTEVGVIKRVLDKDADSEVKSGYWKYISKSEYKKLKNVDKSSEKINTGNDVKNDKKSTLNKNTKRKTGQKSSKN